MLIPIEQAGAIAGRDRAYESFDLPKGTLRGSPPNPSDDLTTLRTAFYVVAQKKLDSDLISDLTESLMNARRDLLAEYPQLDPDRDAGHRRISLYSAASGRRRLLQRHRGKFSR